MFVFRLKTEYIRRIAREMREMEQNYLGRLPESDPLYQFLKYEIQPQLTGFMERPKYRVHQLHGSNAVYLYEEKNSGSRVIGKFFLSEREPDREAASRRLEREFHNLSVMRSCGFDGSSPHYIARPLGRNEALNRLLVIEFCGGEMLSSILTRAIHSGDNDLIYAKLTALAWFLAHFHNQTATPEWKVNFNEATSYMDSLIERLRVQNEIGYSDAEELGWLRDRWREQPKMWEDCQVTVHGDATPDNFLFGDDQWVISFDLERLRRADRVFDTGRIAGELMHFFLQLTGNKYAAEPFIGHFLWEYACHFPDREQTFRQLARRVPFYMGCTLLRIARNPWLEWDYRLRLIHEAKLSLRNLSL